MLARNCMSNSNQIVLEWIIIELIYNLNRFSKDYGIIIMELECKRLNNFGINEKCN